VLQGRDFVTLPIYLTFDDGPHPAWTSQILHALRTKRVTATFFALGRRAKERWAMELFRQMADDGHILANHGRSHVDLTTASDDVVRDEILSTEHLLARFGCFARLFRPPYGRADERVATIARELGYEVVLWNNDPRDWAPRPESHVWVARVIEAVKARDARVVVCHDTHRATALQLRALVDALAKDGHDFATLAGASEAIRSTQPKSLQEVPSVVTTGQR
jgi:peptidoglycan/xylan/chitin deacetylase (PgdA/CDA1 family)